jgi:hypothetical protein
MNIGHFTSWLADTQVSKAIGDHAWVTPLVQTLHILAIAVIMSAILMTNLRALGVVGRDESLLRFSHRYAPWIAFALLALAISGATLIVGEPKRALENPVFVLKMGLLVLALAATAIIHAPLRYDAEFWRSKARTVALRSLAVSSLAVWAGIIFAGRWIAYAVS